MEQRHQHQHQQQQQSYSQRMEALKRLYADVILNTTREAAARIMVSEQKAFCFQKKLLSAKEEALKMLIRLKQAMDAKIADVELTSLRQRSKIEELEAQLHEAEDVVIDLRAQLDQVQNELEDMKRAQKMIFVEQVTKSSAVSQENSCHAKVLKVSEAFPSPLNDAGSAFKDSSFDEQKTGDKIATPPIESLGEFLVENSCVGDPELDRSRCKATGEPEPDSNIPITTVEPKLDRKGCMTTTIEPEVDTTGCKATNEPEPDRNRCMTTNEPELDRNGCKTINEPEPYRNRCKTTNKPDPDRNGCKTTNEPEPDRNRCKATNEPEPDRKGCKTTNEPELDRNRCKTTNGTEPHKKGCNTTNELEPEPSRNGCTQRIHAIEQNLVSEPLSLSVQNDKQDCNVEARSAIKEDETAEMSCDVPSPPQQNLRLKKKKPTGLVDSLGHDNSSNKGQVVNFIPRVSLRKSTSKYKKPLVVPSADQVIKACVAYIPSKANSCPSNNLADSGKHLSKKIEKEVHKNLESHMYPASSLDETDPKPLPQSLLGPGYKTETTKSVNIQKAAVSDDVSVDMPDLSRQGGDVAGAPSFWQNYEAHDLTTDSAPKDIKTCNINEPTMQATDDRFLKYTFQRKRKKGTLSCPNETDSGEEITVKKRAGEKQIGTLEPSGLIIGSPRDCRRLVQVARQLVSLSEKRR